MQNIYTKLVLRDDGDYDHVQVTETVDAKGNILQDEEGNNLVTEEVFAVVSAAEKDKPFGRESDEYMESISRAQREGLLQETDWWANSDVTMTEAQRTYRQALRDITSHANWPHLEASDWPVKP